MISWPDGAISSPMRLILGRMRARTVVSVCTSNREIRSLLLVLQFGQNGCVGRGVIGIAIADKSPEAGELRLEAARCNASVFYRRSPSGQELTIALPNQLQLSMTATAASLAREVRCRSMISRHSAKPIDSSLFSALTGMLSSVLAVSMRRSRQRGRPSTRIRIIL